LVIRTTGGLGLDKFVVPDDSALLHIVNGRIGGLIQLTGTTDKYQVIAKRPVTRCQTTNKVFAVLVVLDPAQEVGVQSSSRESNSNEFFIVKFSRHDYLLLQVISKYSK
jgi:hypothetical protein